MKNNKSKFYEQVPCENFIRKMLDYNEGIFWYILDGEIREIWVEDPKTRLVLLGDTIEDIFIQGFTIPDPETEWVEVAMFSPCDIHDVVFTSREEAEFHLEAKKENG